MNVASARVYFHVGKVVGLEGHEFLHCHRFKDVNLNWEGDYFYIDYEKIQMDILQELIGAGALAYFSHLSNFPGFPFREQGVYTLGTAEAVLDQAKVSGNYELRIQAQTIEDLENIYRAIRTGSIRPEPERSFEADQGGKSVEKLEQELGLAKLRIKELEKIQSSVRMLLVDLHGSVDGGWPLCWKKSIKTAAVKILKVL
jgi:hypothetical protein